MTALSGVAVLTVVCVLVVAVAAPGNSTAVTNAGIKSSLRTLLRFMSGTFSVVNLQGAALGGDITHSAWLFLLLDR
jgi:hypothetical protein